VAHEFLAASTKDQFVQYLRQMVDIEDWVDSSIGMRRYNDIRSATLIAEPPPSHVLAAWGG
jgi:hypothetical protein